MKFKKILAVLMSASMLACLCACNDEEAKKDNKKEIVTETVAIDESSDADEEYNANKEAEEEAKKEAEIHKELESAESDAAVQAEDNAAAIAEDAIANYDPENPEQTVMMILEKGFAASFGDNMDVTYDEADKNYIISVWQDGLADALETDSGAETLKTLSGTLETALESMTTQVRLVDEDANITFNFVSDKDQSEMLLSIYNGETVFNVAE